MMGRLIDADALTAKQASIAKTFARSDAQKSLMGRVMYNTENAPTIDAVPVIHARWILIQNGSGVCSACNRNDHIDSLAAYCRYCGAKMDGERRAEP